MRKGFKIRKIRIFTLVIVVFVILIIPIIIYSLFFYNHSIGNPVEWGAFGDFYSGILNPFITSITTGLLVYITYLLNRQDREHSQSLILFQLKQQIVEKLVVYQQEITSIRSQFIAKESLINCQIAKNKDDFNRLSFYEKKEEKNINGHVKQVEFLGLSVKNFYASVFLDISEICVFFKYFSTSYPMLLDKQVIKEADLYSLNQELTNLELFVRENLNSGNVNMPGNFQEIEREISQIIALILD